MVIDIVTIHDAYFFTTLFTYIEICHQRFHYNAFICLFILFYDSLCVFPWDVPILVNFLLLRHVWMYLLMSSSLLRGLVMYGKICIMANQKVRLTGDLGILAVFFFEFWELVMNTSWKNMKIVLQRGTFATQCWQAMTWRVTWLNSPRVLIQCDVRWGTRIRAHEDMQQWGAKLVSERMNKYVLEADSTPTQRRSSPRINFTAYFSVCQSSSNGWAFSFFLQKEKIRCIRLRLQDPGILKSLRFNSN